MLLKYWYLVAKKVAKRFKWYTLISVSTVYILFCKYYYIKTFFYYRRRTKFYRCTVYTKHVTIIVVENLSLLSINHRIVKLTVTK